MTCDAWGRDSQCHASVYDRICEKHHEDSTDFAIIRQNFTSPWPARSHTPRSEALERSHTLPCSPSLPGSNVLQRCWQLCRSTLPMPWRWPMLQSPSSRKHPKSGRTWPRWTQRPKRQRTAFQTAAGTLANMYYNLFKQNNQQHDSCHDWTATTKHGFPKKSLAIKHKNWSSRGPGEDRLVICEHAISINWVVSHCNGASDARSEKGHNHTWLEISRNTGSRNSERWCLGKWIFEKLENHLIIARSPVITLKVWKSV